MEKAKFTRIKKWATEKGYTITKGSYSNSIRIFIDNSFNGFEISFHESTIYRSIKGMRGEPKGLYIAEIRNNRLGYSFHKKSQSEIIEEMEYEIWCKKAQKAHN